MSGDDFLTTVALPTKGQEVLVVTFPLVVPTPGSSLPTHPQYYYKSPLLSSPSIVELPRTPNTVTSSALAILSCALLLFVK